MVFGQADLQESLNGPKKNLQGTRTMRIPFVKHPMDLLISCVSADTINLPTKDLTFPCL